MNISQLNSKDDASEEDKSENETKIGGVAHQDVKVGGSQKECREAPRGVVRNQAFLAVLSVAVGIVCLWFQDHPYEPQIGISSHANISNVVTLKTHFVPLDPKAFSSFVDSKESRTSLHGILNWKSASVSWKWVHHQYFAPLLPPSVVSKDPAFVWRILPDDTSQEVLYSSKYVAPPPSGPVEELLHGLLSLFHPQPFLYSRYGPRGAAGIIRAKSFDCVDILLRLHAEYQLNPPSRRPLWFTPAAFIGRLVMNTTDSTVKHFSLHVPTDKPLNVDLEWLIGPDEDKDMEVTITFLPEMSLEVEDTDSGVITWLDEISQSKALDLLEKELYKYKQVDYLNFSEAYLKGSSEGKPVHTLVLWGSLADQSC